MNEIKKAFLKLADIQLEACRLLFDRVLQYSESFETLQKLIAVEEVIEERRKNAS